ncbi:MAG: hypothetical protein AAF849_00470 [Bacteroidota bacterium]
MKNTGVYIGLGVIAMGGVLLWQAKARRRKEQNTLGGFASSREGLKVKTVPSPSTSTSTSSSPSTRNTTSTTTSSPSRVVTEPNWRDPFDMNYAKEVANWLSPKRVLFLDKSKALNFAKSIKNAKGAWYENDDEQIIEQIFGKELKDKIQVANLSQIFWELYQQDLWEFLKSFLSSREVDHYVSQNVQKLAAYRFV